MSDQKKPEDKAGAFIENAAQRYNEAIGDEGIVKFLQKADPAIFAPITAPAPAMTLEKLQKHRDLAAKSGLFTEEMISDLDKGIARVGPSLPKLH